MVSILLAIGGGIFVLFGLLHALYTYLDIHKPRRIVPDDPAVIAAMERSNVRLARGGTTVWKAWVGFNFSHSIGLVLLGVLCIENGARVSGGAVSPLTVLVLAAISATYLLLAVRYWFRVPIAGVAIATGCLLTAWVLYAF